MNARFLRKLVVLAALAVGSGLFAADAAANAAKAAATKAASEAAKKDTEKFNTQRDKILANREALTKQLKDATEEQRKEIFKKMKDLEDAQTEMSRQIRDEFRKLRGSTGTSGHR